MLTRQLPGSIVNALWVLVALVVAFGITAVLTWVERDELILSWSKGNPSAQEILSEGGLAALRESPIVPNFLPLAVVSFVVFALLALVLGAFLVDGHGWARLALTASAGFGVLVAVLAVRNHLPTAFLVLSIVTAVLHLALLFFLWHKDTSAYLREF